MNIITLTADVLVVGGHGGTAAVLLSDRLSDPSDRLQGEAPDAVYLIQQLKCPSVLMVLA